MRGWGGLIPDCLIIRDIGSSAPSQRTVDSGVTRAKVPGAEYTGQLQDRSQAPISLQTLTAAAEHIITETDPSLLVTSAMRGGWCSQR